MDKKDNGTEVIGDVHIFEPSDFHGLNAHI